MTETTCTLKMFNTTIKKKHKKMKRNDSTTIKMI